MLLERMRTDGSRLDYMCLGYGIYYELPCVLEPANKTPWESQYVYEPQAIIENVKIYHFGEDTVHSLPTILASLFHAMSQKGCDDLIITIVAD